MLESANDEDITLMQEFLSQENVLLESFEALSTKTKSLLTVFFNLALRQYSLAKSHLRPLPASFRFYTDDSLVLLIYFKNSPVPRDEIS